MSDADVYAAKDMAHDLCDYKCGDECPLYYVDPDTCDHMKIEEDVMDLGDDGDGYVAYPIWVCADCGTSWASKTKMMSDLDYD